MIELKDILVKTKGRVILDVPSLIFKNGKRYGIIGENGSGKTTLLRVLMGTLQPSQGSIEGLKLNNNVGYLPQSPYAFSFSVIRNVSMTLENLQNRDEVAISALEKVGLGSLIEAKGNNLSGGEKQRLGLARVLAVPKEVLLLDEPTSATDIRGMDLIEALLQQWFEQTRGLLIFTTHAPAQALRLADEIIFLEKGRVVETGTPEILFNNPQKLETQAFLSHWSI
ncbi:MAG: ABC transporter ATP-binding protein [Anaerolineaceae bacterium]|jgi:ABC-type multidrug transport system ATPase subunit